METDPVDSASFVTSETPHSPDLGTVLQFAIAPTRQGPNDTVVVINRESTGNETQSDENPARKQGGRKNRRTGRPNQTDTSSLPSSPPPPHHSHKRSLWRRTATFEQEHSTRSAQRRLASTSRALEGVVHDVLNGKARAEKAGSEREGNIETKDPASHDPRAKTCSENPLGKSEGNGVQDWTPADAAVIYRRHRNTAELGHWEEHTKPRKTSRKLKLPSSLPYREFRWELSLEVRSEPGVRKSRE